MSILAHELVIADAPERRPDRWMLFLHGILGRRANWRSFARKWVAARSGGGPSWGAVLVDLRDHGDSQGLAGEPTIAAAGADLVELAAQLTAVHGGRVAGIVGHSFGGKVAIAGAARLREAGRPLDELWVIDAPPGPRPNPRDIGTERIFALLQGLPERFEDRGQFTATLIAAGITKPTAQWLATNLVEDPASEPSWRFGPDLTRLRALLDDFKVVDLWPTLEAEAAAGVRVALVVGERSKAVFDDQREHADALAAVGRIAVEVIPGAGHWVHTDNPDALLEVLAKPGDFGPPRPAAAQSKPPAGG
jgi:esterase